MITAGAWTVSLSFTLLRGQKHRQLQAHHWHSSLSILRQAPSIKCEPTWDQLLYKEQLVQARQDRNCTAWEDKVHWKFWSLLHTAWRYTALAHSSRENTFVGSKLSLAAQQHHSEERFFFLSSLLANIFPATKTWRGTHLSTYISYWIPNIIISNANVTAWCLGFFSVTNA